MQKNGHMSLFLFPEDILLHQLASFLSFECVLNIKFVSRGGHKYVEYLRSKKIFLKRVLSYVEKIGFNPSIFSQVLKYSKSILSGSFLLSILLNQFFDKDQDLDIFSPYECEDFRFNAKNDDNFKNEKCIPHMDFTKIIANNIKSKNGSIPDFYNRYFQNQFTFDDFKQDICYLEMGVRTLPAFYMNNFKIQHNIVIGERNSLETKVIVRDWIKKEFDFDFLKIIFDGNQLIVYHTNSIQERRSMYCPNRMEHEFVAKRLLKYTNRGFALFPIHNRTDTYECKQCRTHPDNSS